MPCTFDLPAYIRSLMPRVQISLAGSGPYDLEISEQASREYTTLTWLGNRNPALFRYHSMTSSTYQRSRFHSITFDGESQSLYLQKPWNGYRVMMRQWRRRHGWMFAILPRSLKVQTLFLTRKSLIRSSLPGPQIRGLHSLEFPKDSGRFWQDASRCLATGRSSDEFGFLFGFPSDFPNAFYQQPLNKQFYVYSPHIHATFAPESWLINDKLSWFVTTLMTQSLVSILSNWMERLSPCRCYPRRPNIGWASHGLIASPKVLVSVEAEFLCETFLSGQIETAAWWLITSILTTWTMDAFSGKGPVKLLGLGELSYSLPYIFTDL